MAKRTPSGDRKKHKSERERTTGWGGEGDGGTRKKHNCSWGNYSELTTVTKRPDK